MILITITTEMIRTYMLVVGILVHVLIVGVGVSKLMRKIKSLRSKYDKESK